MSRNQRLLLLAPPEMMRTAAFERAGALAAATELPLHIVAFEIWRRRNALNTTDAERAK